MNPNTTNILIAGVGGQGVLLVSEILSEACLRSGYDVKKSEVHGIAQRGGSVTSHVGFGERAYSLLIEKGQVDVVNPNNWTLFGVHYIKPTVITSFLSPKEVNEKYPDLIAFMKGVATRCVRITTAEERTSKRADELTTVLA